jgi:type IV fimbrial biogenesis protein FimT
MRAHLDDVSGFTLIELLVVVAIAGIIASMAAPSFTSMIQGSAVSAATNDLFSSIRLARSEAVKRGSRTSVCKSSSSMSASPACDAGASWQDGWVVYNDANENGVIDSEDVVLVHEPLKFGFAVAPDAIFADFVSFNAVGASTTNANGFASGSIVMRYGDDEKEISIMSNGRVRIE